MAGLLAVLQEVDGGTYVRAIAGSGVYVFGLSRGRTSGCATFAIPLTDEPPVRCRLCRAWLSLASRLATDPPWLGPVSPSGWWLSVLIEDSWS